MHNLFPTTSLIWAAIPSLKPEQACVSCLGWGGVETIKIFKKMGNLVISAPQNTIAKTGNQANYRTTDDCIQTMGYIYTMQYFSTIKKQEIMPSPVTEKKVEMIIRSEVRETETDKHHMISLLLLLLLSHFQSYPTLCDPIDVSPPGCPVPRILQTRTLEWVAISFSNA